MRKPAALRQHLLAHLPELERDADRLLIHVESGRIVSTWAPGGSFEYRYSLTVIITDLATDADVVMAALLAWVRDEQPDLLNNAQRREELTFEAEIMANDRVDLQIKLPLDERVVATTGEDGKIVLTNPPEPAPSEWLPT